MINDRLINHSFLSGDNGKRMTFLAHRIPYLQNISDPSIFLIIGNLRFTDFTCIWYLFASFELLKFD